MEAGLPRPASKASTWIRVLAPEVAERSSQLTAVIGRSLFKFQKENKHGKKKREDKNKTTSKGES